MRPKATQRRNRVCLKKSSKSQHTATWCQGSGPRHGLPHQNHSSRSLGRRPSSRRSLLNKCSPSSSTYRLHQRLRRSIKRQQRKKWPSLIQLRKAFTSMRQSTLATRTCPTWMSASTVVKTSRRIMQKRLQALAHSITTSLQGVQKLRVSSVKRQPRSLISKIW